MKSIAIVVVLLLAAMPIFSPTPAMAETGTLTDCIIGCLPNDANCINCCKATFEATEPMDCCGDYGQCTEKCETQEGTRAVTCFRRCQKTLRMCHDKYSEGEKEFNCPNWMAPKECPFECQVWSPASRKCVGAPQGCGD